MLVILPLTLCLTVASAVVFEDCGSEYEAQDIDISGCTATPCLMTIGQNVTVTTTFQAGFSSNHLTKDVYLMIFDIQVHMNVNPEPCAEGSLISCPVIEGKNQYRAQMHIDSTLPPFYGWLYWKLYNSKGDTLVCYKVYVGLLEADSIKNKLH